jgi:O-antigen ligase
MYYLEAREDLRGEKAEMSVFWRLVKGLLVSLGGLLGGGLVGWGIASPRGTLLIPVLGAGGYAFIALASPPAALITLIFVAPLSRFAHLDIPLGGGIPDLSLSRLATGLLLMLFLAQISTGQRGWPRLKVIDVAFLAAMVGIGLSVIKSVELARSFQVFFDSYLVPFLVYFLARNLIQDRLWLERVKLTLVIVGVYLSALIIHEHFTGQPLLVPEGDFATRYSQSLGRSVVLFGNSAFSGALLAIVLPIALTLLMDKRSPEGKFLLALALPVLGLGLFFTYTRAAWLTALLSLLVLQFQFAPLRRFVLPGLALGALGALGLWDNLVSNPVFSERITSEGPILGRLSLLYLGLNFFLQNPIWGIGFDNFRHIAVSSRMTEIINTHNSFLFILVSSGLVGLLPYLASFFLVVKETIAGTFWLAARGEARLLASLWIVLIVYLGNALVIDMVSAPYLNMVLFLLIGCHLGLLERLRCGEPVWERKLSWDKTATFQASA